MHVVLTPPPLVHLTEFDKRVLDVLLDVHAVQVCNAASAFFNKGKGESLKSALVDEAFLECLKAFYKSAPEVSDAELSNATRHVVGCLCEKPDGKPTADDVFGGAATQADLDAMRLRLLKKKDVHKGQVIDYRTLPPTSDTADHHGRRVFLQVQDWLGDQSLNPAEHGWLLKDHPLFGPGAGDLKVYFPKWTVKGALPAGLVQIISCGCKTDCSKAQHCRCLRAKQDCTELCKHCDGTVDNPCANRNKDKDKEATVVEVDGNVDVLDVDVDDTLFLS